MDVYSVAIGAATSCVIGAVACVEGSAVGSAVTGVAVRSEIGGVVVVQEAGAARVSVPAQQAAPGEREPRSSMELIWPEPGSGAMPTIGHVVSATPWQRST